MHCNLVITLSLMQPSHMQCGRRKGTVGWRVASRTLGQGFKPLRCRIAPRIRSQGLEPHMSNQGTLARRCRDPHNKRGLLLDCVTKTIRPSQDRTPGIVPHWLNRLVTISHHSPCQLPAEGGIWWRDSARYGKGR